MKLFNIPLHIDLDAEAEKRFRDASARHFVSFVRVGMLLGLFSYPVWLIWDSAMGTPDSFLKAIQIRVAMMVFFIIAFLASFVGKAVRYIYQIASVTLLATVATTYMTLDLVPDGMMMCGGIAMIPLVFVTAMTSFPAAFATVMLTLVIVNVFLYADHASHAFIFSTNFTDITLALLCFAITYVAIQYRRHAFMLEMNLQRSTAEAEAATRARTELLATMSHEVRTSLRHILGFAGRLRDSNLDGTQKDYVETIRYSGETLLTILSDILEARTLEDGKIDIEPVDFSIERLISGVIALTRSRADEKGLQISPNIDKNVPIYLRGDIRRLRQILMNLVGNAIKYTPKGRVSITVNDAGGAGPDHLIRFQVEDMGPGIPEEQRQNLFTPGSATTSQYDGTGPGLVTCRRIVEMMDGTIGVRSTPDVGSTFWFEVPLAPASPKGKA